MKKYKNLLITVCLLVFSSMSVFADTIVTIVPKEKITTSNTCLQEGDSVEFVVSKDVFVNNVLKFKLGTTVVGLVTEMESNDYCGQNAKITIGQFYLHDVNNQKVKLAGSIYKSGNAHENVLEFITPRVVRGGEVQIKPEKDSFNLYIKGNL